MNSTQRLALVRELLKSKKALNTYIFFIKQWDEEKSQFSSEEQPYIIKAADSTNAYKLMWKKLKETQPGIWKGRWQDLRDAVVEYGTQDMRGPYKDVVCFEDAHAATG